MGALSCVNGSCGFQEQGLQFLGGVAPGGQVAVELCGGFYVFVAVTVLYPEAVQVAKDEAFQHSLWVG